jgi:hypothetical protein
VFVFSSSTPQDLHLLLQINLFLAAVFVLLAVWSGRQGSPLLAVVSRWVRWVVVAIAVGTLLHVMDWMERPLPVLIAMSAIGFGLLDTFRNWTITGALSRSDLPLFPRFKESDRADEWPADSRVLRHRSWLRTHGFTFVKGLTAELGGDYQVRGSVYLDATHRVRLQIIFLPYPGGRWLPVVSFLTRLADGTRVMTDNSIMPFGGFFPADCEVQRAPLVRSTDTLLRIHTESVKRRASESVELTGNPIEEINELQIELEKVNVEMGFLQPRAHREEHGRLTWDGRYRLWREMWLMEYLGRSGRHGAVVVSVESGQS